MPPPLFSVDAAALLGPFGLVVLPLLVGAAAIYLLLPRPRAYPALWGALAGGLALVLAGWLVVGFGALTPESFLFYAFSAAAVGFGGLLVTQRNPARAALSFALVVLATCGLFLLLAAPFLMAATIIIYAGAIIVTFLFVLMLAQQEGPSDADARSREPLLATVIGFVLLGALLYVLQLQWTYETTGEGQVLKELLKNVGDARAGLSEDSVKTNLGLNQAEIMKPLTRAIDDDEQQKTSLPPQDRKWAIVDREHRALQTLRSRMESVFNQSLGKTPGVEDAYHELDGLQTVVLQAKQQYGWPQPEGASPDRPSNLSAYSGPQPDLPAEQVRADPDAGGRPYLPAENPAYLGRSLFTDYLLPVELGGFLLLAATVGAIAIAQRRTTPQRP